MKRTICYISKQAPGLDNSVLESLFSFILQHNTPKNITGILLSHQHLFLQVLEGKDEVLQELFNSILKDQRHSQILTVIDQNIDDRIFADYSAGFSILKSQDDFFRLNKYLSHYDADQNYPKNIKTLLEPFLI